jgi:hypothetical protein
MMLGLLAFQTYPTFRKTNVGYLTMVQTGQSRVIENKMLQLFYTNTQKEVDSLLRKVEKEVKRLD